MALQKRKGNIPDLLSSSNLAVDDAPPASIIYESQIIPPSPSININSVNSEVQTNSDGIKFGNEIFIMTQQPSGEPVLYEATREFQHYLRSQSVSESAEPKKVTFLIVSGNDTQELWNQKRILIKRILIGVVCLAILCGFVGICNSRFRAENVSWYVDRPAWYARPRTCAIPDLNSHIKLVIMTQTGGDYCQEKMNCIDKVRDEQSNGINKNFCDVPHAFLIGGDDRIYEGRGFRQRTNTTDDYYDKAILIGFIGNYDVDVPSKEQFDHLQTLLDESLKKDALSEDYKITGEVYVLGTKIKSVMSTWERWVDIPVSFPP